MTDREWLSSEDVGAMLAEVRAYDRGEPFYNRLSDRKLRLFACACCRQMWHLLNDDAQCGRCKGNGWVREREELSGNYHESACLNCSGTGRINRSRRAVEVAERYADGLATEEEIRRVWDDSQRIDPQDYANWAGHLASNGFDNEPVDYCGALSALLKVGQMPALQAHLLREVSGNPWRPVTLCGMERKPFHNQYAHVDENGGFWLEAECPACERIRTPTVLSLARAAYDERPGRACERCKGRGLLWSGGTKPLSMQCGDCRGEGYVEQGALDPQRLAVLSDALEEAGCSDEDMLRHLRGQERCSECLRHGTDSHPFVSCGGTGWVPLRGPHVRGCATLDTLLGKE